MKSGAYGASLTIYSYLTHDKKVKMLYATDVHIYSVIMYVRLLVTLLAREIYYHNEYFYIILLMPVHFHPGLVCVAVLTPNESEPCKDVVTASIWDPSWCSSSERLANGTSSVRDSTHSCHTWSPLNMSKSIEKRHNVPA